MSLYFRQGITGSSFHFADPQAPLTPAPEETTTTITVDIPLHANIEWGSTNNVLTAEDDAGVVTLASPVTFSAPDGATAIVQTAIPDLAKASFHRYAITDAEVGNFTSAIGDTLVFQDATGMTVDGETVAIIDPAATVSGWYKFWDESEGTFTPVSSYEWVDVPNAAASGQPAITGTAAQGQTLTASQGTITDADGIGTLSYQWLRDDVEISGATASTYVLVRDDVGSVIKVQVSFTDNESNAEGPLTSVATATVVDATSPILTTPLGVKTGEETAAGSVVTDEANGILYFIATENPSENVATIKTGAQLAISTVGTKEISVSGLTPGTVYYLHYVHTDTAGNDSNVATSTSFTTDVLQGLTIVATSTVRLGIPFTIVTSGTYDLTLATSITATLGGVSLSGLSNITATSCDFTCPSSGVSLVSPSDLILTISI